MLPWLGVRQGWPCACCSTNLVTALCTADIGAPPRCIKFRNAIPDERLKFLVGHTAELVYMCALDLLHVECAVPSSEVCFDVIDGFVLERRPGDVAPSRH